LGETSATVLQHAAPLAELCDASLTVMHVVDYSPATDVDYLLPPQDELVVELISVAEKQLQQLLEREALSKGVETLVVSGRAKVEIVRTAEDRKVDLIITGAHGRHGLSGLLGSTSDRVLHQASCDVLTVR
jgi:universal stress protein A